uniref:F-box domain-containing protein n=1 Tax=Photinus pyralis TaxID=7054 RepID=A0A1Y1NHF6_PHOPY
MPKTAEDIILQLYARTPAPCRDYCGLTITQEDVIINIWNITFGPHVYPKRMKCPLKELNEHKSIKVEIERIFGRHVLHYADSLSRNEMKLENLTSKAFLSVLNYLAAKDILNLSQTSKMMFEVMYKCRYFQLTHH